MCLSTNIKSFGFKYYKYQFFFSYYLYYNNMVLLNPRNPAINAIIIYIILIVALAIVNFKQLQIDNNFIIIGVILSVILYFVFLTVSNSCTNKYLPKYS